MASKRKVLMVVAMAGCLTAGSAALFHTPTARADDMGNMAGEKKNIIETATGPNMEKVTTLVKLIKAAGLVDTLEGKGPFTVFAPTNDAFDKVPKETLEALMKPENKEKLKSILLYHVHVGDAIMAKDAKTMSLSTADEGKDLHVNVNDSTVTVNDAKVIKADIVCSNGVIHWVDTVLMP